jgi:hypothetical protein
MDPNENSPLLTDAVGDLVTGPTNVEALALNELRRSSYREVRYIWCQWRGGVLTLRGQVPNFYLKQIAQSVVLHRLEGLVTLDNQVEVVPAIVVASIEA